MKNINPPFEITERIINDVIEIGKLIGEANIRSQIKLTPTLRRTNRIRTIYSSLAIEQNSMDIEQITAVLSGKHVIAPPKDIAEVKNAYEIYDCMDSLDPYSEEDLLKAHGVMVRGIEKEAGAYRSRPIGVVDCSGKILHFGTLPQYVPKLMNELLEWVKSSDIHILIKSCVFHYEFELIHPFSDGNGKMGRLWHTLMLSKWNSLFAWLPVESIIHNRQSEYYNAINVSNEKGESTDFIEFMLSAIKEALQEACGTHIKKGKTLKSKETERLKIINSYLNEHSYIQNKDLQKLLDISPATATRILRDLSTKGQLTKVRIGSHWGYVK